VIEGTGINPIGVAVASLINEIGFNHFWNMNINFQELSLLLIPYDLGLYPILCCLAIFSQLILEILALILIFFLPFHQY